MLAAIKPHLPWWLKIGTKLVLSQTLMATRFGNASDYSGMDSSNSQFKHFRRS